MRGYQEKASSSSSSSYHKSLMLNVATLAGKQGFDVQKACLWSAASPERVAHGNWCFSGLQTSQVSCTVRHSNIKNANYAFAGVGLEC